MKKIDINKINCFEELKVEYSKYISLLSEKELYELKKDDLFLDEDALRALYDGLKNSNPTPAEIVYQEIGLLDEI